MTTPDQSSRATSMKLIRRLAGRIASQRGAGDSTSSLVAISQTDQSMPQPPGPSPAGVVVSHGNADALVRFGMD